MAKCGMAEQSLSKFTACVIDYINFDNVYIDLL